MGSHRLTTAIAAFALPTLLLAGAAAAEEIRGAAVLDHPCGKVAVRHMGLVHAGKMDEAVQLGTPEMRQQFQEMPAEERQMMVEMMQEMSQSEADFSSDIKAHGVLTVEGDKATLKVTKELKDENGSGTETTTQRYLIDAEGCWISH